MLIRSLVFSPLSMETPLPQAAMKFMRQKRMQNYKENG